MTKSSRGHRALTLILRFVKWRDQSEIDVLRGDLRRTRGSQQSVGQFLTTVGFREPPRGRIDQGEALDCGQVRLTLTEDCHGGQALPVGRARGAVRGPQDRLITITQRGRGEFQRPGQVQLVQVWPGRAVEVRDTDDRSSNARATNRAGQAQAGAPRSGIPAPSRSACHHPVPPPHHDLEPPAGGRGRSVGSGIGSPASYPGLGIKAMGRCCEHQPSAVYSGGGCAS